MDLRRFGLLLAIATVLTAIVLTQYPFHYSFTRHNIHGHWRDIDWHWFPRRGRHIRVDRDLYLNLLMLIPLGVGFALWRRASGWRILLEALVLGAVVATGLEVAQLVTLYRYTSFADMWRNTVSCVAGALFVLLFVPRTWRGIYY